MANEKQDHVNCPMQGIDVKSDVSDIKLGMELLLQRTGWIEGNVKDCQSAREALRKRANSLEICVGKIKTSQRIVNTIASLFTVAGLGLIGKWLFHHLKSG